MPPLRLNDGGSLEFLHLLDLQVSALRDLDREVRRVAAFLEFASTPFLEIGLTNGLMECSASNHRARHSSKLVNRVEYARWHGWIFGAKIAGEDLGPPAMPDTRRSRLTVPRSCGKKF